ncbi:MAG: hypothetical protein WAX37_02180 [Minisyncoccia bacterium]
MNRNKLIFIISLLTYALPFVAFAALNGVNGLLITFGSLISGSIIPILFGLSLVYFFWGISQFILNDAGNDKTRDEGKKKIIWGVVALFVFISIYGIIKLIGDVTGIKPLP